jgi:hypothetical protein
MRPALKTLPGDAFGIMYWIMQNQRRRDMRFVPSVITIALVCGLAAPASAERRQRGNSDRYEQAPIVDGGRRYCQPLCTADTSPCDPMEFKRSDGRCNNPFSGPAF